MVDFTLPFNVLAAPSEGSAQRRARIATVKSASFMRDDLRRLAHWKLLDLDISALQVAKNGRVGKPISISLRVRNRGTVLGQAIATVVGVQNGIEVYRLRLNVFDDIGRGDTTFDFGSYSPTVAGDIVWTAAIDDGDPDIDETTETTVVK